MYILDLNETTTDVAIIPHVSSKISSTPFKSTKNDEPGVRGVSPGQAEEFAGQR